MRKTDLNGEEYLVCDDCGKDFYEDVFLLDGEKTICKKCAEKVGIKFFKDGDDLFKEKGW